MGGSASRVAGASVSRAAKRSLPEFERSSRLDAVKPAEAAAALRPESYRAMDAAENLSVPGTTTKEEGLDELLQQLSGSIRAKSTPILMDKQAVAHARKLRSDVQREMNKSRITVGDLERLLSGKMDRALVLEKGVPPDVADALLKHLRLPREDDYVNVLQIHESHQHSKG